MKGLFMGMMVDSFEDARLYDKVGKFDGVLVVFEMVWLLLNWLGMVVGGRNKPNWMVLSKLKIFHLVGFFPDINIPLSSTYVDCFVH